MSIHEVFTGVAVADLQGGLAWYARLMGRQPDMRPNEHEAVWQLAGQAWLYIIDDASRAGNLQRLPSAQHTPVRADRGPCSNIRKRDERGRTAPCQQPPTRYTGRGCWVVLGQLPMTIPMLWYPKS